MAQGGVSERRALVRRELATGEITGLRMLADRLAAHDVVAGPDELRADVRALGALRVQVGDASVLALPVDGDGRPTSTAPAPLAANELSRDPDWTLQLGVVVVVAVFLLVAFAGWLISL